MVYYYVCERKDKLDNLDNKIKDMFTFREAQCEFCKNKVYYEIEIYKHLPAENICFVCVDCFLAEKLNPS